MPNKVGPVAIAAGICLLHAVARAQTPPPLVTPSPSLTCVSTPAGIPPYCADHCPACPTSRPGCYTGPCVRCIENPVCGSGEICVSHGLEGCCSCAIPTPTVASETATVPPTPSPTCTPQSIATCRRDQTITCTDIGEHCVLCACITRTPTAPPTASATGTATPTCMSTPVCNPPYTHAWCGGFPGSRDRCDCICEGVQTPTSAATPSSCVGDCDGDASVQINELILSINVLLGDAPLSTCPAIDCPQLLGLVINCAIEAVANALNGCSPPTPRVPTATPTATATCYTPATPIPDRTCAPSQCEFAQCAEHGFVGTCMTDAVRGGCFCYFEGPTFTITPMSCTPTPGPPTPPPTCVPTLGVISCCAAHCLPCPTVRAGCNAAGCQDCIERPVCDPIPTCGPHGPIHIPPD